MNSISPRPNESNRYLFPVSSNEYVRPLSAVEIVQKFDIKATIEQALQGTKKIVMEDDGSVNFSDYRSNTNFLVEASKITPGAPIKKFLNDVLGKSNSVFGFRISGPILDNASIDELIIPIIEFGKFQYLVELDLSYLILPKDSLNTLCRTLNPVISGYCPIKRLVLTRSELGYYGCKSLFEAICGNLFLEELIVTSCKCTDKAIPYLLKTLINNQNRVRVLGLGGNYLSIESIRELYPVFATHRYLKDIDLHCNPIGDEGADMLLKSIRDNNLIVTLNLSACSIKDCKWATRLQIMTALATFNLSHNMIDDEGCHNLCESLEECVCLRHLDISNNIFRSLGSISLGRMIEKNKALVTLNLSSNTGIIEEVFIAISAGLRENKTLIKLNLSSCDLSIDNAETICQCFADNVTCDVNMTVSNIPEILQTNPRQYTRSKDREKEASRPKIIPTNKVTSKRNARIRMKERMRRKALRNASGEVPKDNQVEEEDNEDDDESESESNTPTKKNLLMEPPPLLLRELNSKPLSSDAAGISLRSTVKWREERNTALQNAKDANNIVDRVQPDDTEEILDGVDFDDGESLQHYVPEDKEENKWIGISATASMTLPVTPLKTDWPKGFNSKSSVNVSPGAKLNRERRQLQDLANLNATRFFDNKFILSVGYGYASELIGSIEVVASTTYKQAKELCKPLIEDYLASSATHGLEDLLENFWMTDAKRKIVEGDNLVLRLIWEELSVADQILVIRPADWVKLDYSAVYLGEEEENDEDGFDL